MPQNYFDIVEGMKYDPRIQDKQFNMIYKGLQDRNAAFEEMSQMIPEAQAMYEATPVTPKDVNYLNRTAGELKSDIGELVKKYDGDYGDPRFKREVLAKTAKTKTEMAKLSRNYEAYNKMLPAYTQNKQNIYFKNGVNPFETGSYDEEGNYMPFDISNMVVRPDYDQAAIEGMKGILSSAKTGDLAADKKLEGYLSQITTSGWDTLNPSQQQEVLEQFAPVFDKQTGYSNDPLYDKDPEAYLKQNASRLFPGKTDKNYEYDRVAELERKANQTGNDLSDIYVFGNPANDQSEETFYIRNNPSEFLKIASVDSSEEALIAAGFGTKETGLDADIMKKIKSGKLSEEDLKNMSQEERYTAMSLSNTYASARKLGISVEKAAKYKEDYIKLFEKVNDRKPVDDNELADFIENDELASSVEYSMSFPVLNDLTDEKLKQSIATNSVAGYRVRGKNIQFADLTTLAKELNVPEFNLRKVLEDKSYRSRYNKSTGEYYINVPTNLDNEGKATKKTKHERLYYTPDMLTETYSKKLKEIKQSASSGKYDENYPLGIETASHRYIYNPGEGKKLNTKNENIIEVYDKNDELITNISISDLEGVIKNVNEKNLKMNYTYKWQSPTQQQKTQP